MIITLARKPIMGSITNNVVTFGVSVLSINKCRIGLEKRYNSFAGNKETGFIIGADNRTITGKGMFAGVKEGGTEVVGRWPANVILKQGLQLEFPFTTNTRHMSYKRSGGDFIDKIPSQLEKDWFVTETGSAARFFFQVKSE